MLLFFLLSLLLPVAIFEFFTLGAFSCFEVAVPQGHIGDTLNYGFGASSKVTLHLSGSLDARIHPSFGWGCSHAVFAGASSHGDFDVFFKTVPSS